MNGDIDKINLGTGKFSLDSSVVIAFFNSNLEYILREIFKTKVYFSSEVFKEIRRYNLSSLSYQILSTKTVEESEYFYKISSSNLSLSVADVHLATICKFNGLVCVSFEKKIRKVCKEEDIKNIGLLHILKEAIELKLVNKLEMKSMVMKLKNDGLYLGDEAFNEILEFLD